MVNIRTLAATKKLVKPSALLQSGLKRDDVKQSLIADLQRISKMFPVQYQDVLIYCCSVIESIFIKSDGCDKLGLLLEILQEVYGAMPPELIQTIKSSVEHLLSRGLIKRVSVLRYSLRYSYEILIKILPIFFSPTK